MFVKSAHSLGPGVLLVLCSQEVYGESMVTRATGRHRTVISAPLGAVFVVGLSRNAVFFPDCRQPCKPVVDHRASYLVLR